MIAYVGIGSNIEPETNVPRALDRLRREFDVLRVSPFYLSPPWARPAQPWFWNGIVELSTRLGPASLDQRFKAIEAALGRTRTSDKHAPRPIDLDLIAADDFVDRDLARRRYLAAPLLDLVPSFRLPDGRALADLTDTMQPAQLELAMTSSEATPGSTSSRSPRVKPRRLRER